MVISIAENIPATNDYSKGVVILRITTILLLIAMVVSQGGIKLAEAAKPGSHALTGEAFVAAQWAQLSVAGQALAKVSTRIAAGSGELAALVRKQQDHISEHQKIEALLLKARRKKRISEIALLQGKRNNLTSEISAIDGQLTERFPRFKEISNPKPLTVSSVQKLLDKTEALLFFLVNANTTYIWAISRTKLVWHKSEFGKNKISLKVRRLRAALDPLGAVRSAAALEDDEPEQKGGFDRAISFELYQKLLEPVLVKMPGVSHLMVVVDGPLTSLPLSVLTTEPPQGDNLDMAVLRDSAWLIKKYAITTLPSVSSLRALRAYGSIQTMGKQIAFRGFGDPDLRRKQNRDQKETALRGVSNYFSGQLADVDAIRSLPSLPQTAKELKLIAQSLAAPTNSLLLGADATETAVKNADLSNVRILAFATHGLISGELRGLAEPALVFTPPQNATVLDDGLLTASEAAQLKLNADWVILSACNTAASDGTLGAGGLSGLARAFLYAGAKALLVSHWPVRDDAASRLTTTALLELKKHPEIGRAEALRRSMLTLMKDEKDLSLAHPAAWAPFVVVGEGGI